MEEARKAYEEALKIYRELAQKNPEAYLPGRGNAQQPGDVLKATQNRMEEARKAYEEALETSRELARKNPETYLPGVAMTLNTWGS